MSPVASTRWCPTPEQVMILEEMYKAGVRTPNATQIQQITAHLSLYGKIEGKNVFYWFQNHKARDRQKLRKRLLSPKPILPHPPPPPHYHNHNYNYNHNHNHNHSLNRHNHVIPSVFDHHSSFQPPPPFRRLHAPPPLPPTPPPPPPPPRCPYTSLPYYCLPTTSTPSDVFAPPQGVGAEREGMGGVTRQQKATWTCRKEESDGFYFTKDKPSLIQALSNSLIKYNEPNEYDDVDEDDYENDDENNDNDCNQGDDHFNTKRPLKTLQLFPC